MKNNLRNIAIIAHVDHGKTTLVDALLRQSKTNLKSAGDSADLIMDSNELERERGITIFSKNASIQWGNVKINIIDTPGHADFGGEVERVLKMADGVLLLVDAKEGPMPQTRFVLKKALTLGHQVIVVINKIDKKDARPSVVVDKTFDLFVELGATDKQTDFPVIYASALLGKAGTEPDLAKMTDISPLLDLIIKFIPAPTGEDDAPLQMLVVSTVPDNFKGKIAIGRIYQGRIRKGEPVTHIKRDGSMAPAKITALMTFVGLERLEVEEAGAGDIAAIAGIPEVSIGETIAFKESPVALPVIGIEKPTVKMTFGVNTSPFAGREGQYVTSRHLRERLYQELETDVALALTEDLGDSFVMAGRGELHLAILIERLRREGYELQVSRPQVILKEEGGVVKAPFEELFIEAPEEFSGAVIEMVGQRRGEMKDMSLSDGLIHLRFLIPTAGLFGWRDIFLTKTKGLGIMNTLFFGYEPDPGALVDFNPHGSLISLENGVSNNYGLLNAQERGNLFIGNGVEVYEGMIVGQNSRDEDLEVNICKTKRLSNMRSKGEGTSETLTVPRQLTLEEALAYIGDDELVEVTPKSLRLRKKILSSIERKRTQRKSS